ncbi:MAG: flavodoxin family protein [Acidipropionibacterium sp.]|nr:flavodoxin family protein [Acidipropionibacterium sp.]
MKALIVVESYFTNTEKIAEAIATGLRSRGAEVDVVQAASAPDVTTAELLIVGAPTHNLGLPKAASRRQAEAKGGRHSQESGVAEWLDSRPQLKGRRAAAFATVVGGAFSGSAARAIRKKMRRRSADVIACEDFRVLGTEGPLADGELTRAEQWGASLV